MRHTHTQPVLNRRADGIRNCIQSKFFHADSFSIRFSWDKSFRGSSIREVAFIFFLLQIFRIGVVFIYGLFGKIEGIVVFFHPLTIAEWKLKFVPMLYATTKLMPKACPNTNSTPPKQQQQQKKQQQQQQKRKMKGKKVGIASIQME